MRLIGYWIRSVDDTEYVPPQELVGRLPDDVRIRVADYLEGGGEEYERYRGLSWCRFYCDREMGSGELSDGVWVWPEDLGHYVRNHGVVLPEEFIRHALAAAPPLPKSRWAAREDLNYDFWRDWCRTHRSGRYRVPMAEANRRADVEAQRSFEAAVAGLEAKRGMSSERCQWVGCTNRALVGLALCARCSLRTENPLRCPAHYDLASVLNP